VNPFLPLLAFAAAALACFLLQPLARRWGLVDRPGGRKTHHGEVPLVGGIAMLLGLIAAIGASAQLRNEDAAYLVAACALLTFVGTLDDRFDLRPRIRLLTQSLAVLIGAAAFTLDRLTLGDIFGTGSITLHGVSAAGMIVLLTAGVVNAMNMVDGADGVAGVFALVALLGLAFLEIVAGAATYAPVALAACGAIAGFLVFNLPVQWNRRVRVFMGDAGSTMLGFLMAWVALGITQEPPPEARPVTTLWVAALPIYDLLWSIGRRVARGRSPFEADRGHLHHLLLDGGLGVRATFSVLSILAIGLAALGIALQARGVPEWASFALFLLCGAGVFRLVKALPTRSWLIPNRWLRRGRSAAPAVTATPGHDALPTHAGAADGAGTNGLRQPLK
jgi:UDP-GlcNAc:undecaprenyl-phosphate GlcNAc-1-phosphate transferase